MYRYVKWCAAPLALVGFSCADGSETGLERAEQAIEGFAGNLSNGDVQDFENASGWRGADVVVTRSSTATSGQYSLAVKPSVGWVLFYSQNLQEPFSFRAGTIKIDVHLPEFQPNAHWFGNAGLRVAAPSVGLYEDLGTSSFNINKANQWDTVDFHINEALAAKLRGLDQTVSPIRFEIALNIPVDGISQPGTYLVDNLRYAAEIATASDLAELLDGSTEKHSVTKSVTLQPGDVIPGGIKFAGDGASGVVFDCNGAQIGVPKIGGNVGTTGDTIIEITPTFYDENGELAQQVEEWHQTSVFGAGEWVASDSTTCDWGYEIDNDQGTDVDDDDQKAWFANLAWFFDQPGHTRCINPNPYDTNRATDPKESERPTFPGLKPCMDLQPDEYTSDVLSGTMALTAACNDEVNYYYTHFMGEFQDYWLARTCIYWRKCLARDIFGGGSPICRRVHKKRSDGYYVRQRPENVTIKNCKIFGGVNVRSFGGPAERFSTYDVSAPGYQARVRDLAPRNIVFKNVEVTTDGKEYPFYVRPGVTGFQLLNSTITGSGMMAIYLDHESSHNKIWNNTFEFNTLAERKRELIAIDGSSDNVIGDNTFSPNGFGGIFLYRNCGEASAVRWGQPTGNQIVNNVFKYDAKSQNERILELKEEERNDPGVLSKVAPAVFLSSRDNMSSSNHCPEDNAFYDNGDADAKTAFGGSSAKYDWDYARYNVVMQNRVSGRFEALGLGIVTQHETINSPNYFGEGSARNVGGVVDPEDRTAGCYLPSGYAKNFIVNHDSAYFMSAQGGGEVCVRQTCHDGTLVDAYESCPSVTRVEFAQLGRSFSGGESGAMRTVQPAACPDGSKIIGAKALCNLDAQTSLSAPDLLLPLDTPWVNAAAESAVESAVTSERLDALDVGLVDVSAFFAGDVAAGWCKVGNTEVVSRSDVIRGPDGDAGFEVICRGSSGCAVRGYLYCMQAD